jgi:hypothetical protein
MSGWCKRFARDTSITPAEIRDVVRDAVARGEKREDVLKRLRQMGLPAPAGV